MRYSIKNYLCAYQHKKQTIMKTFFKVLIASILGTSITLLLLFFILMGIAGSMSVNKEKPTVVKDTSILYLTFDKKITDKPVTNPFDFSLTGLYNFGKENNKITLRKYIEYIRKAKTDPKIKGIYIDFKGFNVSLSKAEEIRNELLNFKKSGKFIIAHSDLYTQLQYYLATVADKIYLTPEGAILFQGINAQIMFYKQLLEKLNIKPEVIRHGKFKSAVEPFILDSMSNANYLQTKTYVSSIWNHLLEGISATRNIPIDTLNKYADNLTIDSDSAALKYHFVDGLKYEDQIEAELKEMLGKSKEDKLPLISMSKYVKTHIKPKVTKNKIAIIYATGEIDMGNGADDNKIYPERLVKMIRKARKNKKVKAIILRVNSPGGSALASEIIWRELMLAKKEKPLIISMGDVAASGGYYISSAGDYIIANPTTITGSIGVFGLLWNAKDFLNNKVGININGYKTNKYADLGSMYRPITKYEKEKMQNLVEKTYHTFLSHVASGRGMTIAEVDSIGQGRVWSGINAKPIKLIDKFGGLDDAIKEAAKRAKIKDYRIEEYPKPKTFTQMLMESLNKDNFVKSFINSYLPQPLMKQAQIINFIKSHQGVMALMPYQITIE